HLHDVPIPSGKVPGVGHDPPHHVGWGVDLRLRLQDAHPATLPRARGARPPAVVAPLVHPFHQTARRGRILTRTRSSRPPSRSSSARRPRPPAWGEKRDAVPWRSIPAMAAARQLEARSTVKAAGASGPAPATSIQAAE